MGRLTIGGMKAALHAVTGTTGRQMRKASIKYDKRRHVRRNLIQRKFGRIKYCRRVAARDSRPPTVFLSDSALVATVIVWLGALNLTNKGRRAFRDANFCLYCARLEWWGFPKYSFVGNLHSSEFNIGAFAHLIKKMARYALRKSCYTA